jgi:hypothetical protein
VSTSAVDTWREVEIPTRNLTGTTYDFFLSNSGIICDTK